MDFSLYAPDWKDTIRPAILKRDDYKCQHCGISHRSTVYKKTNGGYQVLDDFTKEWAKANKKKVFTLYLQVAHLDHNKQNNDPKNLLSLCPYHHAKYDSEQKKLSRIVYKKKVEASKTEIVNLEAQKRNKLLWEMKAEIKIFTGVSMKMEDLNNLLTMIEKSI